MAAPFLLFMQLESHPPEAHPSNRCKPTLPKNEQKAGNLPGTQIKRPRDSSRGGRNRLLEGARWLLPPGTADGTDRNGLSHDRVSGYPPGLPSAELQAETPEGATPSSAACSVARKGASSRQDIWPNYTAPHLWNGKTGREMTLS